MAIKSLDPRKVQNFDITGSRFERVIAEAWATRHDDDETRQTTGNTDTPSGDVSSPTTGQASQSHQPFADLPDSLREH